MFYTCPVCGCEDIRDEEDSLVTCPNGHDLMIDALSPEDDRAFVPIKISPD